MNAQKIILDLPNGDQLVAEEQLLETKMIAISIARNGVWLQDLALVKTTHDKDFNYVEDKFDVYVYGDEYSEDYTDKIVINRISSDAL